MSVQLRLDRLIFPALLLQHLRRRRVLGVSIDAFFHIQPTPDPSIEAQLTHEQEMNQLRVRAIRHKNYLILGLMILLAIALAYGITIDILNPNIGLFQK